MKEKIVLISNLSGGLVLFRSELIKALITTFDVIAICDDTGEGRTEQLRKLGCRVIVQPIDRRGINPLKDVKLLLSYWKALEKIRPKYVITYTIKPNIYAGSICRFKKITYAANITGLGTAFDNGGLLTFIVSFLYRIALKKSKVVFFENKANSEVFLNRKIVNSNQVVVLNGAGVNIEKFIEEPYPAQLSGQTLEFLFMGRVMKEKGIEELFDAFERLYRSHNDVHLMILGGLDENYQSEIDKYTQQGWLSYYGYQDDVKPFIKKCHCFVLPSWHEGMANTNLEAAASGRPVITSNIPGCKEAVIDGTTGILCENKNANSLYEALERFYNSSADEKMKMGVAGRKYIEETFDKNMVVNTTIEALLK